jgi:hypothetical protein
LAKGRQNRFVRQIEAPETARGIFTPESHRRFHTTRRRKILEHLSQQLGPDPGAVSGLVKKNGSWKMAQTHYSYPMFGNLPIRLVDGKVVAY